MIVTQRTYSIMKKSRSQTLSKHSIALSMIGNTVSSSVALATSSFPSSSSDKFAISS